MQVYEQNTSLKLEVSQLESSGKCLSNELRRVKEMYHNLSQDLGKSTFINEAEGIMDQLEGILTETKTKFEKLSFLKKHKVYSPTLML